MSEVVFYTAWDIFVNGTKPLFSRHSPYETVWKSPGGGYAVGDILETPSFDEVGDEYLEAGIVADYLHDEE